MSSRFLREELLGEVTSEVTPEIWDRPKNIWIRAFRAKEQPVQRSQNRMSVCVWGTERRLLWLQVVKGESMENGTVEEHKGQTDHGDLLGHEEDFWCYSKWDGDPWGLLSGGPTWSDDDFFTSHSRPVRWLWSHQLLTTTCQRWLHLPWGQVHHTLVTSTPQHLSRSPSPLLLKSPRPLSSTTPLCLEFHLPTLSTARLLSLFCGILFSSHP